MRSKRIKRRKNHGGSEMNTFFRDREPKKIVIELLMHFTKCKDGDLLNSFYFLF